MRCPKCGTELFGTMFCEQCHFMTLSNDFEYYEDIVEEIFSQVFEKIWGFGPRVYKVENGVPGKILDNIKRVVPHGEKPLLVFDYERNFSRGFVITNKSFVINYASVERWYLKDIMEMVIDTKLFAKCLILTSPDYKDSQAIYLTGMEHIYEFKNALELLVEGIFLVASEFEAANGRNIIEKRRKFDEERNIRKVEKQQEYEKRKEKIDESLIQRVLECHTFDNIGNMYNSGAPIEDSEKVCAVKKAFDVPQSDKIFFVVSGNLLGGINDKCKGIAITTSGIYFKDDNRKKGMYTLYQLPNIIISSSFIGLLKIGSYEFNVAETKKIKNMLLDLQETIRSI